MQCFVFFKLMQCFVCKKLRNDSYSDISARSLATLYHSEQKLWWRDSGVSLQNAKVSNVKIWCPRARCQNQNSKPWWYACICVYVKETVPSKPHSQSCFQVLKDLRQFIPQKTSIFGRSKEISHRQTSKLSEESNVPCFDPFLFCLVSFRGSDISGSLSNGYKESNINTVSNQLLFDTQQWIQEVEHYYGIKPTSLRYSATKIQTEFIHVRCWGSGQDASEQKGDLHSLPHNKNTGPLQIPHPTSAR
jgi:hypothetical protein